MASRRDNLLANWMLRQSGSRGMGLARDVRAGQASPVKTQAAKRAEARKRSLRRFGQGYRNV